MAKRSTKTALQNSDQDESKNLFYRDKQLMTTARIVGLGFSLIGVGLAALIKFGDIAAADYQAWAFWPFTTCLLLTGGLLYIWTPLTREKNIIWLSGFVVCTFFGSSFIFGFTTLVFLAWLVLIMAMSLMVSSGFALIGYIVMLASNITWLFTSSETNFGSLVINFSYLAAVILVLSLIDRIWHLTAKSIEQLQVAREHERLEQLRLTTLINDMVDGVLAIDQRGYIHMYNAAALDILDVNGSIDNKLITDYFKPFNKNDEPVNIKHFLEKLERAEVNRDLKIRYQDGSEINLYLAAAPVRRGYGREQSEGYTLILRDITREKSLEEERDEFISVVSHELRTPIAIAEGNISNAQYVLKNSTAKGKKRTELINKSIDDAHDQVLFLAEMINDLATLSRAERGKLEIEVETINVVELLDELLANYSPDAKEKGLKLSLKYSPKLPKLHSGRLYVHEILQNFITNAIKYTESGRVTIGAKPKEGGVEFFVSDTGIGMSKQDKEKVFDKFYRSEDFRTRKSSGTGLGLYVTMKLTYLLKARVDVESKLNQGSTFKVYFPNIQQPKKPKR